MKKIVILSPAHPLRGGIAALSERLAQEMQAHGHEVIIYSFSLQYPGFLFPGKTQYSSDPAPSDLKILTKVNSINPFNWIKVGLELKKLKPDIIVSRYWLPFMAPSLGTILWLAKRNGHTKNIAIGDNIIPHEKRPGDFLFTKFFVSSNDGFIVMSKSVGEDLRKFTETKPYKIVPHPIYDTYGKRTSRKDALKFLNLDETYNYILFFGFIRDYKGLDILFEAMSDKRFEKKKIKLIVAGEFYGNEEKYKNHIKALAIESYLVLRTDYIPNEEVRYYFGAADLVVQPYKTATQSGISQMAYHFEKPMVVTNVGGLPEIVPHGKAGYVIPVDAKCIADSIIDYFEGNQKRALKAGVKEEKKRFSWASLVEAIEEVTKQ